MKKSILGKLTGWFRPEYAPRVIDIAGMGFLVAAAFLALGIAPALAATGIALLVIGWASE